jgi:UDP-N-acetylmuramate--alanine ligase
MKEATYHFIGLGGIGMSALARILLQKGARVQGSDSSPSALLEQLICEGASVRVGHSDQIDGATHVIYSTAVTSENIELNQAKKALLPILHRSDLLHLLMSEQSPLLVTGTHGKTTTSALLASVLMDGGLDPSFVIGGIHQNWKTNGRHGKGSFFVAEADESDGSFLKTKSFGAIVTNLENDHLDFWKESTLLDDAFGTFFEQVLHPEHLFWCGDDVRLRAQNTKGISYGFGLENDLIVSSFESTALGVRFAIDWKGKRYDSIDLNLLGKHSALNGAAVFGLALSLGVSEEAIRGAFIRFAGTARRMEWKGAVQAIDVYDDYGHHPTEISTTLNGLRNKVSERRIVAVFQPHRFTRTRDLFDSFSASFADADVVVLTDVYGAGELPIEGVTTERLLAQMNGFLGDKLRYIPRKGLESSVANFLKPHDVVMTIGAGDVTHAGSGILAELARLQPKLNVGLLFGGTTSEHAVTLMSANTFNESIDRSLYNVELFGLTRKGEWITGPDSIEQLEMGASVGEDYPKFSPSILAELTKCDIVIPIFHGQQGEDGMMQGFLETLGIPYVGCDYRSGALCMQKAWTKQVALSAGIPTSPFIEMNKTDYEKRPETLTEKISSYPVWIKPVHLGSSIGITRVTSAEGVHEAAKLAFSLDDALIADQEMVGREIEFSLLGNDTIRVGPAVEVMKHDVFHSYNTKYGSGASQFDIPAKLTPAQEENGKALAAQMFKAASCKGLARIDFFLDNEGQFWMNEINPMPGFTKTSAYPQAWGAAGLSMDKLCSKLIILGLHRSRQLTLLCGK